jgi:hypothetical protein
MFSHLKRRIGVLAAVAVMAALVPTLAVSTASAAPLVTAAAPGDAHTEVACPAGSAAAAGFTDTTSTDVDCIAMFGITLGVTATTYEPSASIPRWQMALYLTRTASIAGHTLGSGADQGFTDISGYSAEIQTAVNQLKQLTVTTGTTATTYSPDDNVTREQMAMFVNRLLALTAAGPGGNSDFTAAAGGMIIGDAGDAYNYTDIDGGSVTFEGHTSAVSLYNLGVPGHAKTVTTFGPATNMTRGEMATWLNNALDHTNARPAGLSFQFQARAMGDWGNSGPTASVSYRSAAFAPVAGQVVDMFSWANSTTAGNTQFSADGTCNLNTNTNIVGSSLTKCTIDVGDPSTNASGNIAVGALAGSVAAAGTTSFHAWTAAAATKYDNDIHAGLGDTSTVNQSNVAVPGQIVLSCDVSSLAGVSDSTGNDVLRAANVHHGDTVTITAQMTKTTASGVATPVAFPLNRLTVLHRIMAANTDDTVVSATTSAIYTDATGAATYSFTSVDPLATVAVAQDVIHTVLISDYAGAFGEVFTPAVAADSTKPCGAANAQTQMVFDFQDTVTDLAMKATQTQNVSSYKAAASALAPISRTSTVTMTDKFGDAVTGGTVVFHGGDEIPFKNTAASSNALEINAWATTFTGIAGAPYAATTAVCFTGVDGGIEGEVAAGTVYYIRGITAANPSVATFALTSGGAEHTITGTPTVAASAIAKAHPVLGCASRTVSPAGSASVAWNDTTLTAGADTVHATTYQTQGITDDNAQSAAARATTSKTAYRWIAPGAVSLATVGTSTLWAEVDTATSASVGGAAADGKANHAADINATPVEVDYVNNSMVVGLNSGLNGTHLPLTVVVVTAGHLFEVTSATAAFLALMPINSPVCFSDTTASNGTGNKLGVAVPGVVYYIKSAVDGGADAIVDVILSDTRAATGIAGTALAITAGGTATTAADLGPAYSTTSCSETTYTSYSWDDNDHFYLNSSGGVTTTATSMAGFEGAYVAGVATYGLQGALATGSGLSYATGTLDSVSYQALAANTSIFKLGG